MAEPPANAATVNEWVSVIRRARLDPTTKLVALLLASYATPSTGTDIWPGVALLAAQAGASRRTVQRALSALRAAGLLEQAPRAGLPRGFNIPHRLILAPDVLDHIDVLTPAAQAAQAALLASLHHPRPPTSRHPDVTRSAATSRHSYVTTSPPTMRHSYVTLSPDKVTPSDTTSRHDHSPHQRNLPVTSIHPPDNPNQPHQQPDVATHGTDRARNPANATHNSSANGQPPNPDHAQRLADLADLINRGPQDDQADE